MSGKSASLTFVSPAETHAYFPAPVESKSSVTLVHLKSNRGEIVPAGTVNAADPSSKVRVTSVPTADTHIH